MATRSSRAGAIARPGPSSSRRSTSAQSISAPVEEHIARKAAEGFTLAPLAELRDRPHDVHAVYAAATADIPADDPEDDVPFEDWEKQDLDDPELAWDGSFVVLHEGQPVALAFLLVNPDAKTGSNEMTGTLPAFRGRGLARLAKLASIRWAAEQGYRTIYTGNDAENAPMLSLNRSLGYEVHWKRLFYAKDVAHHPRPRRGGACPARNRRARHPVGAGLAPPGTTASNPSL